MILRPPQVIPEVIARIHNEGLFAGVLVRHGLLAEIPRERERIYLLGTADYSLAPTTSAHKPRTEAYDLRVLAEVSKLGRGGPEEASARVWELLALLDLVLSDDPELDAGGHYTNELRVIADDVQPMTDGWLARAVVRLRFTGWT